MYEYLNLKSQGNNWFSNVRAIKTDFVGLSLRNRGKQPVKFNVGNFVTDVDTLSRS